ncbi:hypothetical protein CLV96_3264 [Leptospira meyeri]|uniref:AbiTii domain-containing protein n=1 Tax=Leptospira meyeri TaxID=29508 RepID=A0A4V3HHV9_LEPME|nr:hypothetical protein [Leptospira meyeri]EKJ88435.1 hypothetical protein LEP1GSC017_0478 [Leptospira meyeri serovar Hardjo str. Went 5]TDY67714.1 hypothetical protein CLV96_3264 [Leptospira meyeri]
MESSEFKENINLKEALALSQEVLGDIELSRIPLTNIALKASRIARLLNDIDFQKIFSYEAAGYPTTPNGISGEIWQLMLKSNRVFEQKKSITNEIESLAYRNSILELENLLDAYKQGIDAARDPDLSVSSANPSQRVLLPTGNKDERARLISNISTTSSRLSERRNFIYQYALSKYNELRFSKINENIFVRYSSGFIDIIEKILPEELPKFSAIYSNLDSDNPEDWANAVHSCRRLLQSVADKLMPSTEDRKISLPDGKEKKIQMGKDKFINRLIYYIETKSDSERFQELIGSDLTHIGERIDSVFQASQKGSHSSIKRQEADRYVIHTFLLLGDILSL